MAEYPKPRMPYKLVLPMTDDDRQRLWSAAEATGESLSAFARRAIRQLSATAGR